MVVRLLPCWPAIFMPLNTRAGVAQAPIEPGERCFLWLPCDAPWPLKLCRTIAPVKPLPLLMPVTSTRSPAPKTSAPMTWPTSKPLRSSTRISARCRWAGALAFLRWPSSGLERRWGLVSPNATWTAEYPSRSGVFSCTTRHGPASITVTGTTRCSSSQIWVMPSLRPRIPLADIVTGLSAPPSRSPSTAPLRSLSGPEFFLASRERSARWSPGGASIGCAAWFWAGTAQPAQTSVGELVRRAPMAVVGRLASPERLQAGLRGRQVGPPGALTRPG